MEERQASRSHVALYLLILGCDAGKMETAADFILKYVLIATLKSLSLC